MVALIERMMARDPLRRPQTPQEVIDALAPYTAEGNARDLSHISSAILGLNLLIAYVPSRANLPANREAG